MLTSLQFKLIGGAIAGALLIGAVVHYRHVKADRDEARARITTICETTRIALSNPRIRCEDVELHIAATAGNLGRCERSLEQQSAKVNEWKKEADMQKEAAQRARKANEPRAKRSQNAAEQFADAMREGGVDSNACMSPALKKAWPGAEQ